MKTYLPNSPEAAASILSMFLLGNGDAYDDELDAFVRLRVYPLLGLTRKAFIEVFKTYCDNISDEADESGHIRLIDRERAERLFANVTDRKKRIVISALALDLCKADQQIQEGEMALLKHMLACWGLTLADIESEFVRP